MIAGAGCTSALSLMNRSGLAVVITFLLGACSETTRAARAAGNDWWQTGSTPDELPHMLNTELPFRYPLAEFTRKIEGNVMLRLYVDTSGMVVPDSTRVSESSGIKGLDAAAVTGAAQLRFKPARLRGIPIAVSMLFPVHFRHPDSASSPVQKDSLMNFTPDPATTDAESLAR
jgi:TonB family protein